jgi:hypothetical protein
MITNDARRTRETNSSISMVKAAFDKNRALFTDKLELTFYVRNQYSVTF